MQSKRCGCDDIECNKRLILDDENRATSETGTFHGASPTRLGVRSHRLSLAACPEPSINPEGATSAMIDCERSSACSDGPLDVAHHAQHICGRVRRTNSHECMSTKFDGPGSRN